MVLTGLCLSLMYMPDSNHKVAWWNVVTNTGYPIPNPSFGSNIHLLYMERAIEQKYHPNTNAKKTVLFIAKCDTRIEGINTRCNNFKWSWKWWKCSYEYNQANWHFKKTEQQLLVMPLSLIFPVLSHLLLILDKKNGCDYFALYFLASRRRWL